ADIVEQADSSKDTGVGYVEDMSDSNGHVQLWSNTSSDAARWPVGWQGQSVIDAVGFFSSGGCYGGPPCPTNTNSYHVVSSSNGSRTATVCETPTTQSQGSNDYYNLMGNPVTAGTACMENDQQQTSSFPNYTYNWTTTLEAVAWNGAEHDFASASSTTTGDPLPLGNCYLSPDGSRAICEQQTSNALVVVTSSGSQNNLGRRYNPLGWIDSTHLLVEVDSGHLAVLDPDSASVTTIAMTGADQMTMPATLPAQL
ncbi:MAG: hypothetical protein JOY68_01815, partial [Candidatus Dormibacteraeota bacterium]|nr:hypothetical protein [Candidatus Dormibacteraeota bacterium]